MSYINIKFPEDMALGAIAGPEFSTAIFESNNGKEYRLQNFQESKIRYFLSFNAIKEQKMQELLSFFRIVQGRSQSFRFKDWLDYKIEKQIVATADGISTEFPIIKQYQIGENIYFRNITKPLLEHFQVWLADKKLKDGYSLNTEKGILCFTTPPKKGTKIMISCQFDIEARFDNDMLEIAIEGQNLYNVSNLKIIEVK